MKLCPGPAVIIERVAVAVAAVSLVVCSVDWSVLIVNIIRLHGLHGRPQLIISSSYT